MKTKLLLLFICVIYINSYAQINFQDYLIFDENNAHSVFATDIDGDGDMDVLSASWDGGQIAWYENTDGQGTFGAQQIITTDSYEAKTVYAADLDGDGDMDVLSTSFDNGSKVAWYENTDGQGTFGAQQIITTNVGGALSVYVTDIDGDGDMDVLSASANDNKIAWYKNNGQGTFGAQQIIIANISRPYSVYATDIDGDGDMDVLSASEYDSKIAWYDNTDGQGTFGAQQIITTNALGAQSVYASDLDSDGDMDVLSASASDNKIAWYENTDGHGNFGDQQIITTNANSARAVHAADIDSDGNIDVLSASWNDNKIAWYKNTDGHGNFGDQQIITTNADGAVSVYATDIDGDGEMDILSAAAIGNKITWYENTGTLAVNQNILLNFSVYPNPTSDMLTINANYPIENVEVYSVLGKKALETSDISSIDLGQLSSGVYIVKVFSNNAFISKRILVK